MSEEWKTLKQQTIDAGGNNFIEVNVKQPPTGENLLIGISKGWVTESGEKRYKTNLLFSRDKRNEIVKLLQEIDKDL